MPRKRLPAGVIAALRHAPLAAAVVVAPVAPPVEAARPVSTAAGLPPLKDRVAAVRAALAAVPEAAMRAATSPNWTNWPKWSKWSNWSNK